MSRNKEDDDIAVIEGVEEYDLHIMSDRFVFLRRYASNHGSYGAVLGGAVGAGIQYALERRSKKQLEEREKGFEGMSVDRRLEADEKSWSVRYDELEKVTLTKGAANKELKLKAKKFKTGLFGDDQKTFPLEKKQAEQLQSVLPTISVLKPRLRMKVGFWS